MSGETINLPNSNSPSLPTLDPNNTPKSLPIIKTSSLDSSQDSITTFTNETPNPNFICKVKSFVMMIATTIVNTITKINKFILNGIKKLFLPIAYLFTLTEQQQMIKDLQDLKDGTFSKKRLKNRLEKLTKKEVKNILQMAGQTYYKSLSLSDDKVINPDFEKLGKEQSEKDLTVLASPLKMLLEEKIGEE